MNIKHYLNAYRSEILKIRFMQWAVVLFFLGLALIFLSFLFYTLVLKFFTDSAYSLENHNTLMGIHSFYFRFAFILGTSIFVSYQFGKEFEWRTMHQFMIKGLRAEVMIPAKYLANLTLLFAQYIVLTFLTIIIYLFFSPESFADTFAAIEWIEILILPLGFNLALSISVFSVSMTFSSSTGLILNLMYFLVIEGVLKIIFYAVASILKNPELGKVGAYLPFTLFLNLNADSDQFFIHCALVVVYTLTFLMLSVFRLRTKEMALVRT